MTLFDNREKRQRLDALKLILHEYFYYTHNVTWHLNIVEHLNMELNRLIHYTLKNKNTTSRMQINTNNFMFHYNDKSFNLSVSTDI